MHHSSKYLEELAETWEVYERPLTPAQCDDTLRVVRDQMRCLSCRRSPAPIEIGTRHFCLPCAIQMVQTRKRLPGRAPVPPCAGGPPQQLNP